MKKQKYYVTMTDRFMSGWGMARGKTNKLIIETKDYDLAQTIAKNARKRSEMKYVNVNITKPRYDPRYYYVSKKKAKELGYIWTRT